MSSMQQQVDSARERIARGALHLTDREAEVLTLVAEGLTNAEIGVRLFISEETVKSHIRHVLAKLNARTRAHAVAIAIYRGLI